MGIKNGLGAILLILGPIAFVLLWLINGDVRPFGILLAVFGYSLYKSGGSED